MLYRCWVFVGGIYYEVWLYLCGSLRVENVGCVICREFILNDFIFFKGIVLVLFNIECFLIYGYRILRL